MKLYQNMKMFAYAEKTFFQEHRDRWWLQGNEIDDKSSKETEVRDECTIKCKMMKLGKT